MENPASLIGENSNDVFLVANPSIFSGVIAEMLLGSFLRVNIISENNQGWEEHLGHLKENKNLSFYRFENLNNIKLKKIIYLDNLLVENDKDKLLDNLLSFLKIQGLLRNVKVDFYFSHQEFENKEIEKIKDLFAGADINFVKDLFGPGISEKGITVPTDLLIDAVTKGVMVLPSNDFLISPVYHATVAREIVRRFLVSDNDKNQVFTGEEISVKDFAFNLIKSLSNCSLAIGEYELKNEVVNNAKLLKDEHLSDNLVKTINWYESHLERKAEKVKTQRPKTNFLKALKHKKNRLSEKIYRLDDVLREYLNKVVKIFSYFIYPFKLLIKGLSKILKFISKQNIIKPLKSKKVRLVLKVAVLSTVIAFFPVILLALSILLIIFSQEMIKLGNRQMANYIIKAGTFTSNLSKNCLLVYSYVPGFKDQYVYISDVADNVDHVAGIGTTLTNISVIASNLSKKMLGEKDYSVGDFAKALNVEIDKLYRQASFFESDIKKQNIWYFKQTSELLNNFDLNGKRSKLFGVKKVIESLPIILSEKGEKNYLLLFQNNMELRPTGGFIGSFAILKFKNGKLADLNVMDVYAADGQLKGHVEPPGPIKDHLNQANWYLRDSNWDPDFITSAQRAEWFVSKEMDIAVDGVVAMDLNFIKDIVAATGPIKIKDFDRTVDKTNLYEIVQYEAEKEFFPGSQQKSNFLTALSKELILSFSQGNMKNLLGLSMALYQNLEEGHIQIFLHDDTAQKGISDLGWSGKIQPQVCTISNCYSDWFGVVEANLGVNKANYFVERKMSFSSYVDRRIAKRRVEINLKSNANPILDKRGTYSTYIRLMAPQNAEFEDVRVVSKGQEQIIRPEVEYIKDRVEAGVWVDVAPSTGTSVTFSWKNLIDVDFDQKGRYMLHWRKQAGTDKDPVQIEVNLPKGLLVLPSFDPSLTGTGMVGYNLPLSKDIQMSFDW